jgi:hypothetical protein
MSEPDLSYIHESLQHIAVPIANLTPDPKNARKHDRRNLDAIKASLDRFGMRSPIVVQRNGDTMIVRAGNGRMTAALELGWSHLPATVFDEDDNEAVAFAVADNRTAELAEWDGIELMSLIDDFDLGDHGFTTNEINDLLKGTVADPAIASLDGADEVRAKMSGGDETDPDSIGAYNAETDYYLIKIQDVPPAVKDAVLAAVNNALGVGGYDDLVARAY